MDQGEYLKKIVQATTPRFDFANYLPHMKVIKSASS